MTELAEVKVLQPHNYREIVKMLRLAADRIEAGEYGDAEDAVFVLQSNKGIWVFGWGKAVIGQTIGLLELGKAKLFKVWTDIEARNV